MEGLIFGILQYIILDEAHYKINSAGSWIIFKLNHSQSILCLSWLFIDSLLILLLFSWFFASKKDSTKSLSSKIKSVTQISGFIVFDYQI